MTANAVLQDAAIDHAIDVLRFERGVMLRMVAELNRADARLMAALTEALMRLDRESFTVARLESLLASVRAINAEAYATVFAALEPEVAELAKVESAAQVAQLRAVVPSVVQIRFPIAQVAWEQVYAAALSRPFQGRLLREWGAELEAGRLRLIRETVRAGFVDGQTTADIIRKVRGTKARRFEDGLLNRPRRELATVVQTALSHTAQTARQASYEANADLVKAVRWVSTLDSSTSPMCRVRDGKQYTADGKHKPIGHKIPWGSGPGRLHFNCRSVSVAVLKSWRELGIPVDDMPVSTRASMDGQVAADLTFGDWFAKQSAARQDEIVGVERGKLFRAGKVKFDKFYDNRGAFLTLEQLRARIAP